MKRFAVFAGIAFCALMAGCGASSDTDNNVLPGSGKVLNPSGKADTPAQAEYQSNMQKEGQNINSQREKDAAAMAAARARTGGK